MEWVQRHVTEVEIKGETRRVEALAKTTLECHTLILDREKEEEIKITAGPRQLVFLSG